MSTTQNSREVAYRLFAAEFEDATLSYSAGDDERAPNYVVTPTGERINRLFTVGALTAVESVTDDLRRGRIADPTGVFVTYAGQYQPTAASFLEQATPPMFVALTGKARTYQPEDSDQVLTSARPEDLTAVDTDTRDRWAVSAAQATLRRIGIMDIAQSLPVRGDALENELESRGVDEARAEGMALAIDHYGTTEFYLESLRKSVIQVLEVIAGNRETVEALDTNPSETGAASLGALPSIAIDTTQTSTPTSTPSPSQTSTSESIQDSAHDTNDAVDNDNVATESDTDTTVTTESSPSQEATIDTDIVQPAADGESTVESASEPDEYATSDPITPKNDGENGVTTTEAENATADDSLSADVTEDSAPSDEMTETVNTTAQDINSTETHLETEIQREVDESEISTDTENTSAPTSASNSDIMSSDEGIDVESGNSDESTAGSADTDDDITADPTEMYELDDDERAEIEDEFVTEFSTGNEVDAPGSADIDVPTAPDEDPSDEETSVDTTTNVTETASIDTGSTDGDPHETPIESDTDTDTDSDTDIAVDGISEASPAGSGDLGDFETTVDFDSESTESNSSAGETRSNEGETESGTETSAESTNIADSDKTQDVDLEQAAVSMMNELDDGDGATREAVINEVVDMHDVSPDAVESAIQSALMSGRCYESGENALKAI